MSGTESPSGHPAAAVSGPAEGGGGGPTSGAAPSPPLQVKGTKDEGLLTEVRLQGGKIATRLAHPWWSPPKDDGYCSSDSTPKGFGTSYVFCSFKWDLVAISVTQLCQ